MKLKVSKGELIISNGLEMADDYLPRGGEQPPPLALVRVKKLLDKELDFLAQKIGQLSYGSILYVVLAIIKHC